jgi:3-hydroxybutyryl-CoA dehydrogenase
MVKKVTIVGCGWMGRGIAQVCAQGGCDVVMCDLEEKILEQAREEIRSRLDYMVEKELIAESGVPSAMSRIRSTVNFTEAMGAAELVIEAVPEVLDTKQEVFSQMDKLCRESTILATNTSALSITTIGSATRRPDRVVGMHWFYPAYVMPPVEIIKGEHTSDQTASTVKELLLELGKVPVVCKEVPGFLINRLQMVLSNEAVSLLEQGVATAEDIDNAARMSLGLRLPFWGPLKSEDLGVPKNMLLRGFEYIYKETGSDRFRPTELLKEKVAKGELGLIAGKGYYDYSKELPGAVARERDEMIIELIKFLANLGYAKLPKGGTKQV